MEEKGKVNIYKCKDGHETVTVNVATGTTPFMISCSHNGCRNNATSSFYRVDQSLTPTYEWYRPTLKQAKKLESISKGMLDHINRGGLVLRKREA